MSFMSKLILTDYQYTHDHYLSIERQINVDQDAGFFFPLKTNKCVLKQDGPVIYIVREGPLQPEY